MSLDPDLRRGLGDARILQAEPRAGSVLRRDFKDVKIVVGTVRLIVRRLTSPKPNASVSAGRPAIESRSDSKVLTPGTSGYRSNQVSKVRMSQSEYRVGASSRPGGAARWLASGRRKSSIRVERVRRRTRRTHPVRYGL